ncbi:MAG: STAS domain-containing protein [Burkholderiaceae bacterium]|nr:STAS domain-containing protein [Burkholderiaceae bacterium]
MSDAELHALEGDFTIHTAAERYEQLGAALTRGCAAFDLSGIGDFDSAGLQLLLAARRTLAARGQTPVWSNPSSAVRSLLALYRLGTDLNPKESANV